MHHARMLQNDSNWNLMYGRYKIEHLSRKHDDDKAGSPVHVYVAWIHVKYVDLF